MVDREMPFLTISNINFY